MLGVVRNIDSSEQMGRQVSVCVCVQCSNR